MPADISIIAKVTGSTFEPYIASNGKAVSEFAMGTVSAEKMFSSAHTENVILTWVFRFFGILMVVGGLKLMFSILPAVLSKIPLLGNIVSAGVKLMCLVFGSAWSIFVMAVAWLFYRPVIGLALLVAAIVGVWFLKTKAKKKSVVS